MGCEGFPRLTHKKPHLCSLDSTAEQAGCAPCTPQPILQLYFSPGTVSPGVAGIGCGAGSASPATLAAGSSFLTEWLEAPGLKIPCCQDC